MLGEIYKLLDYNNGELYNATDSPDAMNINAWVDKGGWLSLANKVAKDINGANIKKVLFVKNNPVIVFGECDGDNDVIAQILQRSWCMARPSFLFLARPGAVNVYSLNKLPEKDKSGWKNPEPLKVITSVNEVLEKLSAFRREEIETGRLFKEIHFGSLEQRADRRFIEDLKVVRFELMKKGLKDDLLKYAHSLIGRSIFIRYLEDRGVLTGEYYSKVAELKDQWKDLLKTPLVGVDINQEMEKILYLKVLRDKDFTYALFKQLSIDFNGDMFPQDDIEVNVVEQEHLDLLQSFLRGDTGPQQKLFFWAYKFDIIPTELISNLYEEFYHKEKKSEGKKAQGTHYTPSSLVEFVLSQILTPDKLDTNPRVLDPACGSGIFLVESYRRMVRHRVQKQNGKPLSPQQLRQILKDQIAGIEIYGEAIRVAAFSLNLAFLNYQEPPDILRQLEEGRRLPNLKFETDQPTNNQFFNILLRSDSFKIPEEANTPNLFGANSADIVIGNPPWGDAEQDALQWCETSKRPVGDSEYSQAFIWRALDFAKDGGLISLLVSSGVLFKHSDKSKRFRKQWMKEITLKQVVNFAHVRNVFFKAISPFAYIEFQKGAFEPGKTLVRYWSAKKSAAVNNQQAVCLSLSDLRTTLQEDLINDDKLWKIYWWGNHRDKALISSLSLHQSLESFADVKEWVVGQGFKGESAKGKNYPSDWLKNYKEFPAKNFNKRYGPINLGNLVEVPEIVHRFGIPGVYNGWRILVKRGITEANQAKGRIISRLEKDSFCFRNSIHGINVTKAEEWERKIILGILWSSLTRYYLFHTTSTWGNWHHEIHQEEVLSIPIVIPQDKELKNRIVSIVDKLRSWDPVQFNIQNPDGMLDKEIEAFERNAEYELDQAIFELYGLSEEEKDLIWETCTIGLDFLYNNTKSSYVNELPTTLTSPQGYINELPNESNNYASLEGYLFEFLQIWNQELEPVGEFSWKVIGLNNKSPMIAVVFSTQNKGDILEPFQEDEKEWNKVLKSLKENLLTPFNSNKIFLEGMLRVVTDTDIFIIKNNERRLWTRSAAREDAEAMLLEAMIIQDAMREVCG